MRKRVVEVESDVLRVAELQHVVARRARRHRRRDGGVCRLLGQPRLELVTER
ncbi:MAG: hypothetical protein U0470_12130 [Anaerolineae bacterium]